MGFKHAPAPWIATKRGFFIELYDDNGNYVGLTNSKENAHIIAAAPELLEALIEIRKLVAHHDKADLAIAKALGQQ
ncbi:hypothetical protein A0O00_07020 [Proteus mirabilis]|nr:hypothetical protein [Proteus mirabilis]MCL8600234.1 hypothetical protein [Proteus mirabilis]OOQ51546.1 hypothetical protein A0O00_07020 [Proteus mirabilis]